MGNPRNVGGIRARSGHRRRRLGSTAPEAPAAPGRRRHDPDHYITSREAGEIARAQREKEEGKGIFRRWNGRRLSPETAARAAAYRQAEA